MCLVCATVRFAAQPKWGSTATLKPSVTRSSSICHDVDEIHVLTTSPKEEVNCTLLTQLIGYKSAKLLRCLWKGTGDAAALRTSTCLTATMSICLCLRSTVMTRVPGKFLNAAQSFRELSVCVTASIAGLCDQCAVRATRQFARDQECRAKVGQQKVPQVRAY